MDLRQRVQRALEQKHGTRAVIAERFAVSVSFVRDMARRVRESGSPAAKARGGGAPRKADGRQDKLLAALVEARGDDTLSEHAASLAALPAGARLSEATICRALQRLRLTQKKKTLFPDERESERVQAPRAVHQAEIVARVDPRDLIFVDEGGCNRAITRLYARSLCGTRARGTAPRNWGDNVSIISALSLSGIVETMHMPGAINGEAFTLYLDDFLLPKLWKGAVVVMDNLGAHHRDTLRRHRRGPQNLDGAKCPDLVRSLRLYGLTQLKGALGVHQRAELGRGCALTKRDCSGKPSARWRGTSIASTTFCSCRCAWKVSATRGPHWHWHCRSGPGAATTPRGAGGGSHA